MANMQSEMRSLIIRVCYFVFDIGGYRDVFL